MLIGNGVLEYFIAETQATAVSICQDFRSIPSPGGTRASAHVLLALYILDLLQLLGYSYIDLIFAISPSTCMSKMS